MLFWANIACFDDVDLFPVWYQAEYELRYEIYKDGLFDRALYETNLRIALMTHQQMAKMALPFSGPSSNPYSLSAVAGIKRAAIDDGNSATAKLARTGRAFDHGGAGPPPREGFVPREAPVHRENYAPREGAAPRNGPASGGRPPACLICLGPHIAYDHPIATTKFRDGATLYSALDGRDIRTAQSFRGSQRKIICVQFNLGKPCDSSKHPEERVHICTLCGGTHPAFSKDATCRRIRDGAFVP